jgi:hypothetical protein
MEATQTPLNNATQNQAFERRALIGGGTITSPAVAAHLRRGTADTLVPAPQGQPVERKAVIGGGTITPAAVAAHLRSNVAKRGRT